MALPANFNITIYQGDTYNRPFQLLQVVEGSEEPLNLEEFSALSQVRLRPEDDDIIVEFVVSIVDASQGKFRLFLSSEETRLLPRVSFYDLQTVDTITGDVRTWLAGKINSPREVSRDYSDE